MLNIKCPNRSWPTYKQVVAKYGDTYAFNAWIMNNGEMFDSLVHAEQLVSSKQRNERVIKNTKTELLKVLKTQKAIYSKRANMKDKIEEIDSVMVELNTNNDLAGIVQMIEIAQAKGLATMDRLDALYAKYRNLDKMSKEEVLHVAELLHEIKHFLSTYNILEDMVRVFPEDSPILGTLNKALNTSRLITMQYKELHEEVLATWLASQVERVNKKLDEQGKHHYKLTKFRIKELLNTATADISTWNKMFGTQAGSSDPLTGLIAARIKEEAYSVHEDNIDTQERLVRLYKAKGVSNNPDDFNKQYLRDAENFEFIPELDSKGNRIVDEFGRTKGSWGYKKRKAFIQEFDEDQYIKNYREFSRSLEQDNSQEGIKKRLERLKEWHKANSVRVGDPEAIIREKKALLTPGEFDRWFAQNTTRVQRKVYFNGVDNFSYIAEERIHSVSKDGSSLIMYKDLSDFYKPAEQYRNPRFAKLMQDPYYQSLYTAYKKANDRVHEAKQLSFGIIPQKRKGGYDKYITGNGVSIAQNLKDDFGHAINVEEYDTAYGLQSPDKKDVKFIPIYYTDMLDERELSLDLLESTLDFYAMANNYHSMSKIEPFVEMVYDAVNGNSVVKIDKRDIQILNAKGVVKKNSVTGGTLSARTDNVNQALIEFLDKVVYGENEITSIMKVGDKEVSMNKLANIPLKATALNGLAANVNSFFNNTLLGNFTMAIESLAGKYFGKKELLEAEAVYFASVAGLLGDLAAGYPKSKLGKMMARYDAIQGTMVDNMGNNISGTALKRMFTTNSLFFLTKGAEHQIQGTGFIAMAKKQKVQLKNGGTISLWDAYDDAGNLKNDVVWSKEDQFQFMQNVHSLNKSMHGVYNTFDSPTLQRRWYGKLALLFRKWIYSGFQRRWRGEHLNVETGEVEQGYYNAFFSQLYTDLRQGKYDLIFGGKLTPEQKQARAKALGEITVMISVFALYAALKGDDDDEPNSWAQDQMILQTRRLAGDFMFFTPVNPYEWVRILQNPTVAISQVTRTSKFMHQLFTDPFEQYERASGYYEKGDYKLEKKFNDLIPIYNQIIRATTPEQQIKEYNRAY
jgi:uncharacterized protein YbcI